MSDLAADFEVSSLVDAHLETYLASRALPGALREAVRYTLFGGGKRLRPVLMMQACRALGGKVETAVPAAAALEMIHAASLVHDDLPAMDDDDLRRGRPTLHRHTTEAMAILAGDAMLTMPYELVTGTAYDPELSAALTSELAVATNDMIMGQVHDTFPRLAEETCPEKRLQQIHENKTGALLTCACRCGALCAGHPPETLSALAEAVGVLFQAVDDLLDETQCSTRLGKATGKDAERGKLTYPVVYGLEGTRLRIAAMRQQALDALAPYGEAAEPLRRIACFIADRDH